MSDEDKLVKNGLMFIYIRQNKPASEKIINIQTILNDGADINSCDGNDKNNTILHIAVQKCEKEVIEFLLKNGAILSQNADNKTPLHIAKENNTTIGKEIVAILTDHNKQTPYVDNTDSSEQLAKPQQSNETPLNNIDGEILYPKRAGTSGVSGQFYETKLLSLVLYRTLCDKDVEECYLAANIRDIGDFDDVCFRFKIEENGKTKHVMCFTQAKHREDPDKARLTVATIRSSSGQFSLAKYFDSFLKVKQKFYNNTKSNDPMFKGEFNDIDCYFILYTPLKESFERKLNGSDQVCKKMLDFIYTGECKNDIFQFDYEDTDIECLTKSMQQEHIKTLGKLFLYFILNKPKEIMTNDLIQIYHPALAQHVIKISKGKDPNYLEGQFRDEFFEANDELLISLKETLYNEIVFSRSKKTDISKEIVKDTIKAIAKNPSAELISTLIGEVLYFDDKTNKLCLNIDKKAKKKFKQEDIREITNDLQKTNVSPIIVKEAIEICGKEKLKQLKIQLPYTFGNTDFPSNLKGEEIPKDRLDFLCNKFYLLIKENQENEENMNNMPIVIDICDKNVGPKKILEHSHLNTKGIGGTVGNLLQFDPFTQMFQFNTAQELLSRNAKYMLQEIRKLIKNDLSKYRFNVQINNFPRMYFSANQNDKKEAMEFFSKLWFFTSQAKEETVETILKKEINDHYNADKQEGQFLFRVHSDAIFLRYHDEIQKWWKSQTQARYLTKTDKIFEKARKDIIDSPVLTALNIMFVRALKQFNVKFNNFAINSMNLDNLTGHKNILNIVSVAVMLTATKILQFIGYQKNYTFLNLEYVHILPKNDYDTMIEELKEINAITLVIVCETSINEQLQDTLSKIINAFNGKIITITDKPLQLKSDQNVEVIIFEDKNINLVDLDTCSQKKILEEYKLTYQGKDVPLNIIIDEQSKSLVCAKVLWLLLNKNKIEIGNSLNSHKYDEIKNYYINRCLLRNNEEYEVNTLNDIEDKVVLITSMPCMGKTILLTHLALETKKIDPKPWIVNINLSNYSNEFADWQDGTINITKIMRFLCKAVLKKPEQINNLKFKTLPNGTLDVDSHNSHSLSFELKCFINHYNKGNVIFLFDGFDRIYLQHTKEGIELIRNLKDANQRMWITSSCYNIKILEDLLGTPYTLDRLARMQQESFLTRFWKTNLKLEALNHEQLNNINLFLNFIFKTFNDKIELVNKPERPVAPLLSIPMHIVYLSAVEYFKNEINNLSPRFLRETIKEKWRLNSFTAVDRYLRKLDEEEEPLELAGTPLHMYIAANYFQVQIKEKFELRFNQEEIINKSHLYLNTIRSYERFLKVNMKHICEIENKNNLKSQEKARDDFMETHKKLALFAICKESDISKLLTESEIREVKNIIKRIESGDIKTHFIDCVVDGIPRFYNFLFAEYFLVEFASDLIKRVVNRNVDHISLESLWDFVVNFIILLSPPGVRNAFDYKLKYDPELAEAASNENCDKIIFDLILKQNKKDEFTRRDTETAINLAVREGLVNVTNLLLRKAHHVIDSSEVDVCLNIVKSGAHMLNATNQSWKPVTDKVLDNIKDIDGEKVIEILKSDQVEGMSRAVVELCKDTGFEKSLQETIKSDVCKKVKEVKDKLVSLSGNNENLTTLVQTLPYHLPDIVNSLFGKNNK